MLSNALALSLSLARASVCVSAEVEALPAVVARAANQPRAAVRLNVRSLEYDPASILTCFCRKAM